VRFFPISSPKAEPVAGGNAQIKVWNIFLKMSGSLRFAVVIAGLLVLVGAILDGHKGYVADSADQLQRQLPVSSLKPGDDSIEKMRLQLQRLQKGKDLNLQIE
jgi:hypothetical protein